MHPFAAASPAPALVRTVADSAMRIGEVLPLERTDLKLGRCSDPNCAVEGAHFHVIRTAHDGQVESGTKNDHGEQVAGRVVPCPPGLESLIRAQPAGIDTPLLFPTPTGKLR